VVLDEDDRPPQPRRDADRGRGMTVTIGRVRPDPILDLRLVACGHNIIRGAAGAALLNAELLVARGLVTAEGVVGA
jgi:aspartate-semialdehyde dehydrogenase